MPLYEYRCLDCQQEAELLIRGSESPECPTCHSHKLEKMLSVPAAPSINSGSGALPISHAGGGCGLPQCGSGRCQFDD